MFKAWWNIGMLAAESQQVMWLRFMRLAAGGPIASAEAQGMVSEKLGIAPPPAACPDDGAARGNAGFPLPVESSRQSEMTRHRIGAVSRIALSPCGRGLRKYRNALCRVRGTPHPKYRVEKPSSPLSQGERAHRLAPSTAPVHFVTKSPPAPANPRSFSRRVRGSP